MERSGTGDSSIAPPNLSTSVNDTFDVFRKKSSEAIDSTIDLASDAYTTVKETAGKAADGTKETFGKIRSKVSKSHKNPT
ncbi:MAG: hypothetical protein PHV02_17005 [Rhodocyclaceae bacterium]|nr:hypothetical protein [Rhodocyclaceae bacterium]